MTNGDVVMIENATEFPEVTRIREAEEPFVKANVIMPTEYMGEMMKLIQERRGIQTGMHYIDSTRVELQSELPLANHLRLLRQAQIAEPRLCFVRLRIPRIPA
jgi:GTP-binding protein LepA